MRRVNRHLLGTVRTHLWWIFGGAAALTAVAAGIVPWPGVPAAVGQQASAVTQRLSRVLSQTPPTERIPVLIEVDRVGAPLPIAVERDLRAAEHASNLASLYRASTEVLQRDLPADLALDIAAGRTIWIGGALAAELTASQVRTLDSQSGIRRIYYDGLVEVELAGAGGAGPPPLWAPGLPSAAQDPSGGLPWGLEAIGAPRVWAAGATGEGAVVAIIDSGVDADHPLLWRKWRGLRTPPEQSWFDPWGLTDVPVDDDATRGVGHGTIVATVAVGSLEPGDTLIVSGQPQVVQNELEVVTGVAPGAEWVAANAFEVFGGGDYTRLSVLLQSMQWVLDPDGDPATVSDIPDVLNNSWGFRSGGCEGLFDRAIDALELSGVPVIFAAGNRSAGFDTVAAPADRADLLLNSFAVGAAIDDDGQILVAPNSLGGPSPCAPGAVKPEVVAPGDVPLVRGITQHTAQLQFQSGAATSWAAPHVTGAIAVLAGLNPSAGANELKDALFSTAEDLPPPGLDNRSGAGFIDLVAAAQRIGGLGGVQLALERWAWDSAGTTLKLELFNAGDQPFPGGTAELSKRGQEETIARGPAPPIGPRNRGVIEFANLSQNASSETRFSLRLASGGAMLELQLLLGTVSASSVLLVDGAVQFSLDANGRLGKTAGSPGFSFLDRDWLTGAAFMVAVGDQVSDAAYVDVLQQRALKSNPVGSDTDWREVSASGSPGSAVVSFDDARALYPLGATTVQSAQLVEVSDSAAFAVLRSVVEMRRNDQPALAGLFLDWDLGDREVLAWDEELGASVMTAADTSGPWMALTTSPQAPTTHAAVALGTPQNGFYVGVNPGVLAQLEGFTDEEKARLMALGGQQSSDGSATDWAHMVSVGPLAQHDTVVFLIAAGSSRGNLQIALDSARAFAVSGVGGQVAAGDGGLQLLPPYPNPFDPIAGEEVILPYLVNRGDSPVNATLEIYTIAGWPVYYEQRELPPDVPVQPFRWNGLLDDGASAATGVYGYIIKVGGQSRWGKFVLLK